MKPAFAVENLSYAFGSRAVLTNLSFSVPRSHLFIIIGPNGAGKTTLIKLMMRILKMQTGQIEILQAPLGTYSPFPPRGGNGFAGTCSPPESAGARLSE
ncbi:MAG: ABC transporter ATP-binding protein [Desulfobacterales bacterium]